jgi:hypothetical protein
VRGAKETRRPHLSTCPLTFSLARLPQFTFYTSWNTTLSPWPGTSLAPEGDGSQKKWYPSSAVKVPSVQESSKASQPATATFRRSFVLAHRSMSFTNYSSLLFLPSLSIVFSGRTTLVFSQPSCLRKHLPQSPLLKAARYRHLYKLGFSFYLSR